MNTDSDDYGKKIGKAIRAIRAMHEDTAKLVRSLSKVFTGKVIYSELAGGGTQETYWMTEGMKRYWGDANLHRGLVEGLNAVFADVDAASGELNDVPEEPLLILGQIQYVVPDPFPVPQNPKRDKRFDDWPWLKEHIWDFREAYLRWRQRGVTTYDEVIRLDRPQDHVEWVRVLAVPLYSIQNVEHVRSLMGRVRDEGC
jgi:hypothetical protein